MELGTQPPTRLPISTIQDKSETRGSAMNVNKEPLQKRR